MLPSLDIHVDHNRKSRNAISIVFKNATLRNALRRQVYCSPLGRSHFPRKVSGCLGMVTKLVDLVKKPPVVLPAMTEQEIAMLTREPRLDLDFVVSRYGISFPPPPVQTPAE